MEHDTSGPTKRTVGKLPLLPAPADREGLPSSAFGIEQAKSDGATCVRRGEDWRRSFANQLAASK